MTGADTTTASSDAATPHDGSADFPTDLGDLAVGEEAGLIDFEHRHGYGRIAIERTADGEADKIKLQKQDADADNGYSDLETITTAGRWFARGASWDDLPSPDHVNE